MTISAISSAPAGYTPPDNSLRQSFTQLSNALQSGDLASAQSAYAAFTQAGGANSSSPFGAAAQQVGDALQSGDVGKAQQALAQLQQQMQSMRGHHHRGGHHQVSDSDQSQTTTAQTSDSGSTDASTATSTSGNLVDVTA